MKKEYTACIDLDVCASELAESWINGNKSWVISMLKNDHPGLTALLIVQFGPFGDNLLSVSDCNEIANRVIDDRAERYY